MHYRISGAFLLLALASVGCLSDGERYTLPAEWEAHDAVWVSFFGGPMDGPAFEAAAAIAPHTPVICVVPRIDFTGAAAPRLPLAVQGRLASMGVEPSRLEVVRSDSLVQTRDTGPIFVRNSRGELHVVDFRWSNYGQVLSTSRRDTYPFDSLTAVARGIPVVASSLALEGGAIETNGAGTILQVESVTLQRNPDLSRAEIEAELTRVLGHRQIIWLPEGPAEDPQGLSFITGRYFGSGVGGHVDQFARFVDPLTIFLAYPDSAEAASDPVKRVTRERMERNFRILEQARDIEGRPFEIVKAPVPDVPYRPIVVDTAWNHPVFSRLLEENPSVAHGDTLHWVPASSYLNFFITNGVVLVPTYWRPGQPPAVREEDQQFQELMARHFPERKIVGIDASALNNNGGGLHCWTQQQPSAN